VGRVGDGGYVMADDFSNIQVAFSFGIGKETSWDSDIAQRGIKVFQYDHSVDGPPLPNSRFVFHKKMIGAEQTKTSESIASSLCEHGTTDTRNVLKIDVEGSEGSSSMRPAQVIFNASRRSSANSTILTK
jgi:hypothetical protein